MPFELDCCTIILQARAMTITFVLPISADKLAKAELQMYTLKFGTSK